MGHGEGPANLLDLLKQSFNANDALAKLAYIHEVKHLFQYMLNPVHELIRLDQLGLIALEDDAFTMTVKSALSNLCSRGLLPAGRCQVHHGHMHS